MLRLVSIPDRDQDVGVKVVKNVRCSQGEVIEIGLSRKNRVKCNVGMGGGGLSIEGTADGVEQELRRGGLALGTVPAASRNQHAAHTLVWSR